MQYIMPVFILFLGWSYPAGLALYWTTSTVFQAIQQYFVTGWGSLLVKPDFKLAPSGAASTGKSNGTLTSKNYTSERRKERRQVERVDEPYEENVVESDNYTSSNGNGNGSDGPIGSQDARTSGTPYNRRRQRSSSASARRRSSSSTQRSRS
jgi:YidC/Oxa1 family membrane protein insertase